MQTEKPESGGRLGRLVANPPEALVLVACAVLLGLRRAQAWSNPQFWAEDILFYQRAYILGWREIATPFAGYLHSVLRVIAEVAALGDPRTAPLVFVTFAAAGTLYVASRTLSERCPLPRLGGFCALAVVLVPDTYEVLLNVVNLQWVLAAGLILLLLSSDPSTRRQWAHDAVAAVSIGLTGPFCLLLLPLFAGRAWLRRTRASVVLAALIAGCCLVQGYFLATAEPPPVEPHESVPGLPLVLPAVTHRIGGSLLMGSLMATDTDLYVGTLVGVATLAGVGFLAFRPGPARAARAALGLTFALVLAAMFVRTRNSMSLYFQAHEQGRYLYLPQLIAIWLLLATCAQRGQVARLCAALAAWALLVNVPRLREPAYIDMHWHRFADMIRANQAVTVPTNPRGWYMHVPARGK